MLRILQRAQGPVDQEVWLGHKHVLRMPAVQVCCMDVAWMLHGCGMDDIHRLCAFFSSLNGACLHVSYMSVNACCMPYAACCMSAACMLHECRSTPPPSPVACLENLLPKKDCCVIDGNSGECAPGFVPINQIKPGVFDQTTDVCWHNAGVLDRGPESATLLSYKLCCARMANTTS